MAQQHFYSRVPARVSMYNKADGFDTFAHSDGLEQEFIERDLSVMYDNKISKADLLKIRRGEFSPVYSQSRLRSGKTVQCCISFLPLDYTGERSSYLAHSLVLSEEERKMLFFHADNVCFRQDVFLKNIASFDITSPRACPNRTVPLFNYIPESVDSKPSKITQTYREETIKSFLYAVLLSLIGKGKNVYFKLPDNGEDLSCAALDFINEVMKIIPFHLRESLSFVTRVTDYTQYPSFKLKGVSSDFPELPASKGVFFDLQTDIISGLQHDEVVANKALIAFFYSLFDNNELRCEYLSYINRLVTEMPNLQNMNMKTLTNITFLFWQCSGLFPEQSILPNDGTVYDFLNTYEKYRSALTDEYRTNAYRFLHRYIQNHEAIPKNIFSKISRLYPSEIKEAKRAVMNVVLQLIHTDIMREKLFSFIRNNYDGEEDSARKTIQQDLCRVFYGGFLQKPILNFFTDRFESEGTETQNIIVEKLLLTIRTTSVQKGILAFFDRHYDHMTGEQRKDFYRTFYEMLPECDALSAEMVGLVNRHIINEPETVRNETKVSVLELLEADCRKKEHSMLSLLTSQIGFCNTIVTEQIFHKWNTRKVFKEYIELLHNKPIRERIAAVIAIAKENLDNSEVVTTRFLNTLNSLFKEDFETTPLSVWLSADEEFLSNFEETQPFVCNGLRETVSMPGICASLYDAFRDTTRKELLDEVLLFAKRNPMVSACNRYQDIQTYVSVIDAAKSKKAPKALHLLQKLPRDRTLRASMAKHLQFCIIERDTQPNEESMILDACVNLLKTEQICPDQLYQQWEERFLQSSPHQNERNQKPKKNLKQSAAATIKLLMDFCASVYADQSEVQLFFDSERDAFVSTLRAFANSYGSGAKKWLHTYLSHSYNQTAFFHYYCSLENELKKEQGSIFIRLFKK